MTVSHHNYVLRYDKHEWLNMSLYYSLHTLSSILTSKNLSVSCFPAECLPVIKTSLLSKSRRSSSVYSVLTAFERWIFNFIASPIVSNGFSSVEQIIYSPHSLTSLTLVIAATSMDPCVAFSSLNHSRWLLHSFYKISKIRILLYNLHVYTG